MAKDNPRRNNLRDTQSKSFWALIFWLTLICRVCSHAFVVQPIVAALVLHIM